MTSESPEVCRQLEGILRERFGARSVLLTGSGTQALELSIRIGADRDNSTGRTRSRPRVALPAYSCFDLATAAVGADAEVRFYDLDPNTLGPDLESFRDAVRAGADVAVVAPLYGFPVAWDDVQAVAANHDVVLIEDAAQAGGAEWKGQPVGSLAELTVLSFGRGKGWTGGGGGALLTRGRFGGDSVSDRALADARFATSVRAWGTSAAQWGMGRPGFYELPARLPWLRLGETRYREPVEPSTISRFSASLAAATALSAWREREVREAAVREFERALAAASPAPGVRLVEPLPGARPGYLRLPVRLAGGLEALPSPGRAQALGVMPGYPRALDGLAALRSRALGAAREFTGAAELVRDLLTVPTHRYVGVSVIREIVSELRRSTM